SSEAFCASASSASAGDVVVPQPKKATAGIAMATTSQIRMGRRLPCSLLKRKIPTRFLRSRHWRGSFQNGSPFGGLPKSGTNDCAHRSCDQQTHRNSTENGNSRHHQNQEQTHR